MKKMLSRFGHGVFIGCLLLASCSTGRKVDDLSFPGFPLDQTRIVEVELDEESFADLTARERLEQIRDWLLMAVASDAGLLDTELNEILYDLPSTRQGYMQPVANFEYGPARSRYLGAGRILMLVPTDSTPAERFDLLARAADEHRKNNDEQPRTIYLFEYSVDAERGQAQVSRRETVDASQLFTAEAGYTEMPVTTLADFEQFMGQIEDVTYVKLSDGTLTLGGRKLKGHAYRGIRVEDVAAIWQSERKIAARLDAFELKARQRVAELDSEVFPSAQERDRAKLALLARLQEEHDNLRLVDASGFSLDWQYDFDGLAKYYKETLEPELQVYLARRVIDEQDLAQARRGLEQRDGTPFFKLLGKIEQAGPQDAALAKKFSASVDAKFAFQQARYDGELQGTEVGMVLFYTDLLAKLWALDFINSTPGSQITDFRSITQIPGAEIYKAQAKQLPSTRLWFGPQNKGFQGANNGPAQSLLFGRNATRVYAASSHPFNPGVETAPNAEDGAFIYWWDDHYEEIARFEPEYERLNEIMKWSLVFGWLNEAGKGEALGFLGVVPVTNANWFPEWVKHKPELRFQEWDQLNFRPYSDNEAEPEALPLLSSAPFIRSGSNWHLYGGVSLAGKRLFSGRPVLARGISTLDDIPPIASRVNQRLWRSNLIYDESASTGTLRTMEGATYNLTRTSTRVTVTAGDSASAATKNISVAKLRGASSEIPSSLAVERNLVRTSQSMTLETNVGNVPLGRLNVERTENGLKLGWRGREMDSGHALALRLSRSSQPERLLKADPAVSSAFKLGNGDYLVELKGQQMWLRLAPDSNTVEIPLGWQSRVSSTQGGSRGLLLKWTNRAAAQAEAKSASVIKKLPGQVTNTERVLADDVAQIDVLLAEREFVSAARLTEESLAAHGPQAELQLRLGLAKLGRGRSQDASQLISQSLTNAERKGLDLLDEISERLSQLAPNGRGVLFYREGNTLVTHYHLAVPEGSQLKSLNDFAAGRSYIYVADHPGLNNLNWSPAAAQQTLRQVIAGDLGAVVKLPRGSVGEFRPAVIFAGDSKTALRSIRQTHVSVNGNPNISVVLASNVNCESGATDDEGRCVDKVGEDEDAIYLILPKQK